ncbi:MAG: hypothetical protein VCA73_18335 [Roseibacillus sp.]
MARHNRPSGRDADPDSPQEEVVRLPVPEHERSPQLEEMPAPQRPVRMQSTPQVDLMEEESEEVQEPTPAELGVGWDDPEETGERQTPMGWLVLIGVMLILLGAWALMKVTKGEAHLEAESKQVRAGLDQEERERQSALALLTRVEKLATRYLLADDVVAKAAYVRHRERVLPLMQEHYQRHDFKTVHFESIEEFYPIGVGNYPFIYLTGKGEGGESIPLLVEQLANGDVKFDWESEVSYQPMEIAEYLEKKPTEPMDFRVYARLDTFYGFEFSDPKRHLPLFLTFRDADEFLFGYIERGTPGEVGLSKFLRRQILVGQPVILRLRFLPGTQSHRSVLVEKVVAPRWVLIDVPEGEPER